jgi:glucokinase
MFYATIGRGVGGALIFDGHIWRGVSGFAGEFGHIAVDADGLKLEDVASREGIVRRTRERFHQDHTSSLSKFGEEEITISDIVTAAENEDDFAQMMLKRTGFYIGTAIASVINLLNIEKIIVGGEIMEAKHLVLDAIIERAGELSFAPSFETTQIVEGELGDNATAIGAAFLSDES